MKEYKITFTGVAFVEAENAREAKNIFDNADLFSVDAMTDMGVESTAIQSVAEV